MELSTYAICVVAVFALVVQELLDDTGGGRGADTNTDEDGNG
ncbi:hypothetical protein [Streptomyces californicus]